MKLKSSPAQRVSPKVAEQLRRAGFACYGPGNQYGFPLADPRHPQHREFKAAMAKIQPSPMEKVGEARESVPDAV